MKDPQNGRKYLQIVYLIRSWYWNHIKDTYNSTTKDNPVKRLHPGLGDTEEMELHLQKRTDLLEQGPRPQTSPRTQSH